MNEDFSYYLDAARFRQRAIAAQQVKQPAKKDKQPQPAPIAAKRLRQIDKKKRGNPC